MAVKIVSITLLLLSVYLCGQASAAHRNPSISRMCCVAVTTSNVQAKVVGETYEKQAKGPPCVEAVIFNTNDGKVCADPKAQWVQKLIANMRKA